MTVDAVEWASVAELAAALDAGEISAVELAQHCLDRIAARDERTNAVLALNPAALSIAAERDHERAAGQTAGPLHGIPVLVKDNLDTGDGMPTTAGSLALEGTCASEDSGVVARLRAAGAVLLGKTNLSEWANFRSARSSSGWSSLGGQVRNPHALDRTPGGSSSGSGVTVAAGYCPLAIGTETSGSIVNPSAMNGIVGIKPTVGLVGRSGIIPIAAGQDTAGPMARSVADAAAMLGAIAGSDPRDGATAEADARRIADYAACADPDGLRGRRLGLAVNYCGFDERVDALIVDSLDAMRDAGAEIIEVELVRVEEVRPYETEVMLYEFKAGIDAYLAGRDRRTGIRSLSDVAAFNRANAERVMPFYGQDLIERALEKGGLDDAAYRQARATSLRLARDEGLDRLLREHRLDAVLAPSAGLPWLIDWANGDNRRGTSAGIAAVAGYPNISVPAGSIHGLPLNLSFVGPAWGEPGLIAIAAGFEHVSQARLCPAFADTADFTIAAPPCLPSDLGRRRDAPGPW